MTVLETVKEHAILIAAEEEFMEKGYDGAKTQSIAKRAGVTHAMLHYYYRTKENLFNKVFEEKVYMLVDSIIYSFKDKDLPFLIRIQKGIEAHFDFLARNPKLPRFVLNEMISKPERLNIFKNKIFSFLGDIVINLEHEMQHEIKAGNINNITLVDLLLDIASINVFQFAAFPIACIMSKTSYNNIDDFLAARRKESVTIIMNRLIKK